MSCSELRGLIHLPLAHTAGSQTARRSVHQVILCITKAWLAHGKGNVLEKPQSGWSNCFSGKSECSVRFQ